MNPYAPSPHKTDEVAKRRSAPSVRWIALPLFILGGSVVAGTLALVLVDLLLPKGEFIGLLGVALAVIAFVVGAVVGLTTGIGFARGTYLD